MLNQQEIYVRKCRVTETRTALDSAIKEYTVAIRALRLSDKVLIRDICESMGDAVRLYPYQATEMD